MCISTGASFAMAGLLAGGGLLGVRHTCRNDRRYLPLALMPLFVGLQQALEGLVWAGLGAGGDQTLVGPGAAGFLFFTWILWPGWVPYMVAAPEPRPQRRRAFLIFSAVGVLLGLCFYVPYFWLEQGWSATIAGRSIAYLPPLLTQGELVAKELVYALYLGIIALPPLFSSHLWLKLFGAMLCVFVPVTYVFFATAGISVLCFFAAVVTLYLVAMILQTSRPVETGKKAKQAGTGEGAGEGAGVGTGVGTGDEAGEQADAAGKAKTLPVS